MPHVQYTVVHLHIARGLIINVCEASVRMLTDAAAAFFLLGRGFLGIRGHFCKNITLWSCGFWHHTGCWTVTNVLPHGTSTSKIEAACSSGICVITYQTSVCKNPEDCNVFFNCC